MKIAKIAVIIYYFLLINLFFINLIYAEDITITTYYPSPFGSYRELSWGNLPASRGLLKPENGSSIDLGGSAAPYIAFFNDMTSNINNPDARIRLTADDELTIEGADLVAVLRSNGFVLGRSDPGPAMGVLGYFDPAFNVRAAVYGNANNPVEPANWAGYFEGKVRVTGDFEVLGNKSAVVTTEDFGRRLVYSMESPEVWLEDFGSASLVKGRAIVKIDPIFLQSVNTEVNYYIFITPQGDNQGLYIAEKDKHSFVVKEVRNGKSNIKFDYRIIANRKGCEHTRLSEVAE